MKREYGRVLFERDLAQKNLKVANFQRGDEFQEQRNSRAEGMDVKCFELPTAKGTVHYLWEGGGGKNGGTCNFSHCRKGGRAVIYLLWRGP